MNIRKLRCPEPKNLKKRPVFYDTSNNHATVTGQKTNQHNFSSSGDIVATLLCLFFLFHFYVKCLSCEKHPLLKTRNGAATFPAGRSTMAHNAGDSVSAVIVDSSSATHIVTANCR